MLYELETLFEPLAEIAILSTGGELSLTNRYFIQRVTQDDTTQVPREFQDLAHGNKIHCVIRKEISELEFDILKNTAQSQ